MRFHNSGIPEESMAILYAAVERKLAERGCQTEATLSFFIKDGMREDEYLLRSDEKSVEICSGGVSGAFAGAGEWLRSCRYDGGFVPFVGGKSLRPEKPIHGMYFASHFHNFYQDAPVSENRRLIEDLALRGCNALMAWYDMHHYESVDEPASREMIARLRELYGYASLTGMKTVFGTLANEGFKSSPEALRAEWAVQNGYTGEPMGHYHVELCPNREGGIGEILRERKQVMEAFRGVKLDYISIWDYDQGGCTCEKCAPWGGNGFLKTLRELMPFYREECPGAKLLASTWYFDRFVPGEWERFRQTAEEGDYTDVEFLFGYFANEEPVPAFIREKRFPMGKGMVSFPEISMYGATPWGGFGANPMPGRMESNFRENGALYCGMLPYSEGIFEDVNKAMMLDFYSGKTDSAADALRDYAKFEFCLDDGGAEDFVKLCYAMEETWLRHPETPEGQGQWYDMPKCRDYDKMRYILQSPERVEEVYDLAHSLNERIPERMRSAWRWRVFLLRSEIDMELKNGDMHLTPRIEEISEELVRLYWGEEAGYSVTPLTRRALLRHANKKEVC